VFLESEKIAGSLMTIDPVLTQPLTTPQFPDPAEAIRYIDDPDAFYGHDYVFLEDAAGMRCARSRSSAAARSTSCAPT
jgi:hypothetical protein